ncbi:MAG: hypothetical protein HUU49_00365 [Candidatus Buchananbacteria bacterium]|nr:hypothetical protein [Candidatus Buchananbacteria bacterium]
MTKRFTTSFLVAAFIVSACLSFTMPVQAASHNGQIVKMSGSSSLYYVASDGKRYVFPNEKIFKSWFPDFRDVVTLTYEEMSSMPLGGNVLYRPGVLLVKIQTDPRIYAVTKNGVLRWVETEEIAKYLYGDNWNLLIDDVPDSFFVNYKIGESIDSTSDFNADDEVSGVDTIEANHGLALGNAKRARTVKCRLISSSKARECANITNDDTTDDTTDDTANDTPSSVNGEPYITAIQVSNGGEEGYIDTGDTIKITFNETIDPDSINANLEAGNDYVTDVSYSETGGVKVASSGVVTVTNIAAFDMGSVDYSENFVTKLALSASGKVLSITLTAGSDIEIIKEDFSDASQTGGTVKDQTGSKMKSDSSISDPTGTFGGVETESPYITGITVADGGEDGYIDTGDKIEITFSEAIDPESIDNDLEVGDYITNVSYVNTGGVRVSSSGKVTITNIASFDMGAVDSSETFTVKLALNSTGKVLTITLTSGSDLEITDENFSEASQIGDIIKDQDGNKMASDSSIGEPTGSFGGNANNDDSDPYITAIEVADGGEEGYIDVGDTIEITFNEAVDPESINDDLSAGGTVTNVLYSETGGVRVSSAGELIISDIATFNVGSVAYSKTFTAKLALSATSKVLTITLTGGSDVEITDEDFDDAKQTGGTIKDEDGNVMESDTSISDPTGTFGGSFDDGNDDSSDPYITAMSVTNGGDNGYVDVGDAIAITFNEAIDPESINDDLEAGQTVTGVSYSETGGVRVSSSGQVTINNIAAFDIGGVENSETYTVKLALNSTGKILTITLTSGNDLEINDEDFSDASQTGGTLRDQDDNEMNSDATINDPSGTFGGSLDDGSNDGGNPSITTIQATNGGDAGYIDIGDKIEITFSEAIDPESINSSLEEGDSVTGVPYSLTGGVSVFSAGAVIIQNIAIFDVGSVLAPGTFTSKLALNSTGKVLTITITGGSDVKITSQSLSDASQTGGTVEDQNGNEMKNSSVSTPRGSL